jgi:hypothetical protein
MSEGGDDSDGNPLQATENRLESLRRQPDTPLPGTAVVQYDRQYRLFDRASMLEDAHALESIVLDRMLNDLQPDDPLLAARYDCILQFLYDGAWKGVSF